MQIVHLGNHASQGPFYAHWQSASGENALFIAPQIKTADELTQQHSQAAQESLGQLKYPLPDEEAHYSSPIPLPADTGLLHIHHCRSLWGHSPKESSHLVNAIKLLRSNGAALVHQDYDGMIAKLPRDLRSTIVDPKDLVLVSRQDASPPLGLTEKVEYFPPLALLNLIPEFRLHLSEIDPDSYPQPHQVRFLYISDGDQRSEQVVQQAAEQASAQRLKFEIKIEKIATPLSLAQLGEKLIEYDVVIESPLGTPFGALAVQALSLGRVVLSGNFAAGAPTSERVKLSPVIDTSKNRLGERIASLAREPKAIKDLRRRSMEYCYRFHDAPTLANKLKAAYQMVS
jgi:hypothetical protein